MSWWMMPYSLRAVGCAWGRIHTMKCWLSRSGRLLVLPPFWWATPPPSVALSFQLWGVRAL